MSMFCIDGRYYLGFLLRYFLFRDALGLRSGWYKQKPPVFFTSLAFYSKESDGKADGIEVKEACHIFSSFGFWSSLNPETCIETRLHWTHHPSTWYHSGIPSLKNKTCICVTCSWMSIRIISLFLHRRWSGTGNWKAHHMHQNVKMKYKRPLKTFAHVFIYLWCFITITYAILPLPTTEQVEPRKIDFENCEADELLLQLFIYKYISLIPTICQTEL